MDGGAEPGGGLRRAAPGDTAPAGPPPGLSPEEYHSLALLRDIGTLLAPVLTPTPTRAEAIMPGGGGSDISPSMADGVPGLGESTTGAHYFDWHHTEADTLDKVDPTEFLKNVASLAVMT